MGRRHAAALRALCAAAGAALLAERLTGSPAFAVPRLRRASGAPAAAAGGRAAGSRARRAAGGEARALDDPRLAELRGLAQQGLVDQAEDVLYEMLDVGQEPRAAHYSAVIDACASAADYERAERWLFRMQALEVQPDISTFNALLKVAAEAKDASGAGQIIEDIEAAGLEPTLESFNMVLRAVRGTGDAFSVEPWLERIYACGMRPDASCLKSVVATFADNGLMDKVEEWLAIMHQAFPGTLDADVFNMAMRAYASQDRVRQAERVFEYMEGMGVQPNAESYAILTGDGAAYRDPSAVEQWSQRLLDAGVEIDQQSYVAVIGAWAGAGDASKVDEWFMRMVGERKHNADALALVVDTLMLVGGEENEETALEWVSQFRDAGMPLSPAVYAAMVSGDVYSGDFEQVEAKMQQMEADGLEMDDASLAALLLAYANAEPQQSLLAEQTFKQFMLKGKIAVTKDLLEALRAACGGARCLQLRRELQLAGPSGTPASQLPVIFQGREVQTEPGKLAFPGQAENRARRAPDAYSLKGRRPTPARNLKRRWASLMAAQGPEPELAWE